MMGHAHALSGAVVFLAVAPLLPGTPDALTLIVGAGTAAGAALLPDLDHPESSVARALGPITRSMAAVTAALAGGHRQGTHSLLGVLAAGLVAAGLALTGPWVTDAYLAFLCAIASASVNLRITRSVPLHVLVCVAAGGLLVSGAWLARPSASLIVTAVVIGATTHIVGDTLTREGCPWLWPAPWRARLPLISTGGVLEQLILTPALGVIATLQIAGIVWPAWWREMVL